MNAPEVHAHGISIENKEAWAETNYGKKSSASSQVATTETQLSPTETWNFDLPPNSEQRLTKILAATNPFLEASQPLLRALADMPRELTETGMRGWRQILEEELRTFSKLCDQANLRRDHMLGIRYALCTALDEAANLKPWAGGVGNSTGPWSGRALLQSFHQEGDGGQKVFLLIGRLAASPKEHLHVLEVMLHILGLGFEGHYRTQTDGARMLESVRHHLFAVLAESRETVARELSPHRLGVTAGQFRLIRSIPPWSTAVMLGLAALAMFGWFKYELVNDRRVLENHIREIGSQVPVVPKLRLKDLLSQEIAANRVSVEEDEHQSKVMFRGDDMFLPAQAEPHPKAATMLDKVAGGINEVTGSVEVTGHSDNQPISTPTFPNNQILSEKRAEALAKMLQARGVESARLSTKGAGDSQPVADNASAAGRSKNRRVEILVRAN